MGKFVDNFVTAAITFDLNATPATDFAMQLTYLGAAAFAAITIKVTWTQFLTPLTLLRGPAGLSEISDAFDPHLWFLLQAPISDFGSHND